MLFVSPLVYSEEFTYTCSESTNIYGNNAQGQSYKDFNGIGFTMTFKVNTLTQTIIHTDTFVDDSEDDVFNPREITIENKEKEEIIFWEYPQTVFTYTRSEIAPEINHLIVPMTRFFDFKNGAMIQFRNSGGLPRDQIHFTCIRT